MSVPCDSRVIFLADVSTDVIDYPVAGRREKVRTERTVDTKPVTLFPDIDEEIVDQIPCLIHGSQLCGYEIDQTLSIMGIYKCKGFRIAVSESFRQSFVNKGLFSIFAHSLHTRFRRAIFPGNQIYALDRKRTRLN